MVHIILGTAIQLPSRSADSNALHLAGVFLVGINSILGSRPSDILSLRNLFTRTLARTVPFQLHFFIVQIIHLLLLLIRRRYSLRPPTTPTTTFLHWYRRFVH